MQDINYQLRQSYFSLISGNVIINGNAIPYYYSQVPLGVTPANPDNYILLNTIYSTDVDNDEDNMLTTIVQLMIVTKGLQNNAGAIADDIAGQICQILAPYPRAQVVQITSGKVLNTKINLDTIQTGLNDGEKKVINRIINFLHLINVSAGANVTGNIFYGVQITNADPTDFSNSFNQDASIPVSVDYGYQPDPMFYWLAIPSGYAVKSQWQDLNKPGNAGEIGGTTDLFQIRSLVIASNNYTLYMTRYLTAFNLTPTAQVRFS